MNTNDAAHTPESIGVTSGGEYWGVLLLEDGSPLIMDRPEPWGGQKFYAKNYATGAWDTVFNDYVKAEKWGPTPQHANFQDKLGVTAIDGARAWLLKNFTNDDPRPKITLGHWCDERYYKDVGNVVCFKSRAYMEYGDILKTTIKRPVEY
eukprot:Polyplicarium_translucidae@DN1133_c0_g1_i1.p1